MLSHFRNIALMAALFFGQPVMAFAMSPDVVDRAAEEHAGTLEPLKKAAERHEPEALYRLGTLVFEGTRVRRDLAQAADLLKRAADKGHAPAQNAYGYLLQNGLGVAKDEREAVR